MTYEQFMYGIFEMEEFYETKMKEKQKEIYFKNLKFLSENEFKSIIEECYRINKFIPKLSEMLEIYDNRKGQINDENKTWNNINLNSSYWYSNLCDFCDGYRYNEKTGNFDKTNNITPYYDITKGTAYPLSPYKT